MFIVLVSSFLCENFILTIKKKELEREMKKKNCITVIQCKSYLSISYLVSKHWSRFFQLPSVPLHLPNPTQSPEKNTILSLACSQFFKVLYHPPH